MSGSTTLVVIHGAPTPPGRLFRATEVVLDHARSLGSDRRVDLIDLSAMPFGTSGDATQAVETVTAASAVVMVSPVYRASIPGALKWLIDELPVDALKFKPVGIVAMGGSPHHYLAVDRHLRDILAWFGALVAPTSVYATGKSFDEHGAPTVELNAELRLLVDGVLALASRRIIGPEPLAASAW
jgi:FMN reductase